MIWFLDKFHYYLKIPVKSVPIDEVIEIAKDVTESSKVSIIALTGLNTCNYGIDIGDKKQKLHLLLQELSKIESVKFIEVHSLTIGDMYEELTTELANNPKVLLIGFSVQSGSNKMHKIMSTHQRNHVWKLLGSTLSERLLHKSTSYWCIS